MKLKQLFEPTPLCPNCKKLRFHLHRRRTILGDLVYDCPNCQATFEEIILNHSPSIRLRDGRVCPDTGMARGNYSKKIQSEQEKQ